MAVSFEEYQKIIKYGQYARWFHTNLHMHTPAVPKDWDSQNKKNKAQVITPEIYFEELNKTDLDVVAITDHNTVKWCKPLMELAKNSRESGENAVHILPGVEITTIEGPHIIGIFEENIEIIKKIESMLTQLGIKGDGSIDDMVGKTLKDPPTIFEVFKKIHELGGLVIAPHIHSGEAGLFGCESYRGRKKALDHELVSILAAPSGSIKVVEVKDKPRRFLFSSMNCDDYLKSYAFINVSDCHRLEDFTVDTTYIKMSEPTLEGIRQIVFEPELRVCNKIIDSGNPDVEFPLAFHFAKPEEIEMNYPYILGLAVHGGNLDGEILQFSPNLNCIIGKNYAGKSAILDMICFALDIIPDINNTPEKYNNYLSRLEGILKEGSTINLYVQDANGQVFGISRTLSLTTEKKITFIDQNITISRLLNDEFSPESQSTVNKIFTVETYPQGEVVKIKDNADKQIAIVDSLANIFSMKQQLTDKEISGEMTVLGKTHDSADNIIKLNKRIESLDEIISGKKQLEEEIDKIEKIIKSGEIDELKKWGGLKSDITLKTNKLLHIKEGVQNILEENLLLPETQEKVTEIEQEKEIPDNVDEFTSYTEQNFTEINRNIAKNLKNLVDTIDQNITQFCFLEEKRNSTYNTLLEKLKQSDDHQNVEDSSNLIKLLAEKNLKLDEIKTAEDEKGLLLKKVALENKTRDDLLLEFENIKEQITHERMVVVEAINKDSAEDVKAELLIGKDYTRYKQELLNIINDISFSGNTIRNKESQVNLICESFSPRELAEHIRNSANDEITGIEGIKNHTSTFLCGMGEENVMRLEASYVNDQFRILFKKEGEDSYTPIDSGLSGGEQALALISVALIPKKMPLIIDQPEDELGPSLISENLVNQIRSVKSQRQLIFVTHVANIPILGDSEQIMYIKQDVLDGVKSSKVTVKGSLGKKTVVESLLELDGGKKAFEKREQRYSQIKNHV
jgi:predicted ATPase